MDEMRPIAEVHKDLIAQAEANAKVNAEAHAAQVEENKKFQTLMESKPPAAPDAEPAKPAAKQTK